MLPACGPGGSRLEGNVMTKVRSIAVLALAASAIGASSTAHALLPSIEWNCCQLPAYGADRPECKAFARTADRCAVVTKEFAETARAFEAVQKRAMGGATAQSTGLRDSSGAAVQDGSGHAWTLPSMAP